MWNSTSSDDISLSADSTCEDQFKVLLETFKIKEFQYEMRRGDVFGKVRKLRVADSGMHF